MKNLRSCLKEDIAYMVDKISDIKGNTSPLTVNGVPDELYRDLGILVFTLYDSSHTVLGRLVESYTSLEDLEKKAV